MSNYSQSTFFGPKDSLPLGNPSKIILGTDVDTELAAIAVAIATKYDATSIQGVTIPFGSGAVGTPSMTFQADTTTGFYRQAAETIGVAANGALVATIAQTAVTLQSGVSLTVGGALTVSTGGSSLKGGVSVTAPTSGIAFTANGLSGQAALSVSSGSGPTTVAADLFITRNGSTANADFQGPNLQFNDQTNGNASLIQNSGGQTEFWQFNSGGSWRQLARFLAATGAGGQVMQIPDDGGTMQNVGYRGAVPNTQNGAYTLQLSDRGKTINNNSAGSYTYTLPPGVFSAGDIILFAPGGSTTITLAQGAGVSLFWANGTTTSGNRTLTGVCFASVWYAGSNVYYVTGSGIS